MRLEIEARSRSSADCLVAEPERKGERRRLADLHTVLWGGSRPLRLQTLDDRRAEDHIRGPSMPRRAGRMIFVAASAMNLILDGAQGRPHNARSAARAGSNLGYSDKPGCWLRNWFMRTTIRGRRASPVSKSFLLKAAGPRSGSKRSHQGKQVVASFESRQGNFHLTLKKGGQSQRR